MAFLYLSAAHKSSGKTTITLGICRALRDRGLRVQAFKKGPDYIDPIWHGRAAGDPSYNLDFNMMSNAEIDTLFATHASTADISLIEGNKGLYDGMDLEGSNSNAALAKQLRAPVVLVLDCSGMTRGIAPLLLGYQAFDHEVHLAGVILNKVSGARHESKLRAVMARYCPDITVLGAIHRHPALAIAERHLGLIPGNEDAEAEARIAAIADVIRAQLDLQALLDVAGQAPEIASLPPSPTVRPNSPVRIGYALDRAFGFYYTEDLDTLRASGVELLPVDMLNQVGLPELDGLIIGGGFPEVMMEALQANEAMRKSVHQAIMGGLPVYAECGGLMYLCRSINWADRQARMVGVIPADVEMTARPVGRGYATLEVSADHPLEAPAGTHIEAHEFHHSRLINVDPGLRYGYAVKRGHGIDGERDGIVMHHLLAAYCHRRGSGPNGWIQPFLNKVREHAHGDARSQRIAV